MKLLRLDAKHYRSLRDVSLEFSDLNLFIGANASGKSTLLDTLRFLQEAVQTRDFRAPVFSRGGIVHLAWKGKEAEQIHMSVRLQEKDPEGVRSALDASGFGLGQFYETKGFGAS